MISYDLVMAVVRREPHTVSTSVYLSFHLCSLCYGNVKLLIISYTLIQRNEQKCSKKQEEKGETEGEKGSRGCCCGYMI